MKDSQKLRITIEDIQYETTYGKLDSKLKVFANKLESQDAFGKMVGFNDVYVGQGNATLFVKVEYVGKAPKIDGKPKLFGWDEEELMAKQYK